ncbi:MAG: aryl-sulfate sulfotransferase [Rhodospirillales bacterium]|jgi:predicted DNA-binding ribbon-helix-helix protein|nr:aryl-sulfate sulfotransferase [Rhodospirillales bacterium]
MSGPHLAKRSVSLAGHRTSIALEPAFWAALERVAQSRAMSLTALIGQVDAARADSGAPLASALRVFALSEADARG